MVLLTHILLFVIGEDVPETDVLCKKLDVNNLRFLQKKLANFFKQEKRPQCGSCTLYLVFVCFCFVFCYFGWSVCSFIFSFCCSFQHTGNYFILFYLFAYLLICTLRLVYLLSMFRPRLLQLPPSLTSSHAFVCSVCRVITCNYVCRRRKSDNRPH